MSPPILYKTPLQRSQSLPHLVSRSSMHTTLTGSCNELNSQFTPRQHDLPNICSIPYQSRNIDELKQLMTIRQHYYPESGWGWFILLIGVFIQSITFPLHISCSVIVNNISVLFGVQFQSAGKAIILFNKI